MPRDNNHVLETLLFAFTCRSRAASPVLHVNKQPIYIVSHLRSQYRRSLFIRMFTITTRDHIKQREHKCEWSFQEILVSLPIANICGADGSEDCTISFKFEHKTEGWRVVVFTHWRLKLRDTFTAPLLQLLRAYCAAGSATPLHSPLATPRRALTQGRAFQNSQYIPCILFIQWVYSLRLAIAVRE